MGILLTLGHTNGLPQQMLALADTVAREFLQCLLIVTLRRGRSLLRLRPAVGAAW